MPTDEPTNLRTLADHLRRLITLTQDETAIDILMDCANDLSNRASELADPHAHPAQTTTKP